MPGKPDYRTLRSDRGFTWFVGTASSALWTLAEIPIRDYYLSPSACIEAYRKGRPLVRDLFGPDVRLPPVCTPLIKYGHISTLGSTLTFPVEGEVVHCPLFASLEEGITHLQRPVEFGKDGMAPFYLEFRKKMQEAFPEEKVRFGWQWEGPVTTAWELVGPTFMYALFEKPNLVRRFLELSTASIVEFCRFFCDVEKSGTIEPEPDQGRLCDDIAAMLAPDMWPDFVLPYWDLFYRGPVAVRRLHCEDMKPQQLQYLEQIGVRDYDPGISPKLNPKIIAAGTRVPFGWRLGSFHYSPMTCKDVKDFVYQAGADGASYAFTYVESAMCEETSARKVRAFISAAKELERLIDSGESREEIGRNVSPSGREKFWNHWPE